MPDFNVLLVILDSVRAKNTSLHGYGERTTPFLESFAEEAE
jgi:glucan phosphoethanolaminetransferase (alkaline phosphatase superfamily)